MQITSCPYLGIPTAALPRTLTDIGAASPSTHAFTGFAGIAGQGMPCQIPRWIFSDQAVLSAALNRLVWPLPLIQHRSGENVYISRNMDFYDRAKIVASGEFVMPRLMALHRLLTGDLEPPIVVTEGGGGCRHEGSIALASAGNIVSFKELSPLTRDFMESVRENILSPEVAARINVRDSYDDTESDVVYWNMPYVDGYVSEFMHDCRAPTPTRRGGRVVIAENLYPNLEDSFDREEWKLLLKTVGFGSFLMSDVWGAPERLYIFERIK